MSRSVRVGKNFMALFATLSFLSGVVIANFVNVWFMHIKHWGLEFNKTKANVADNCRHNTKVANASILSNSSTVGVFQNALHQRFIYVNSSAAETCSIWNPLDNVESPIAQGRKDKFVVPSSIFTVVKECYANNGTQRSVFLSWTKALPGLSKIVLFASGDCDERVAVPVNGVRIAYETGVDTNPWGLPLVHSMFERMQGENKGIVIFVNSDIFLQGNLDVIFERLSYLFDDWLAISLRWDVDGHIRCVKGMQCSSHVGGNSSNTIHDIGGVDFWAFNSDSNVRILRGKIPPFLFARAVYDNWLTHQAIESGLRSVVDISQVVCLAHLSHERDHVDTGGEERGSNWATIRTASWEVSLNTHLAFTKGSFKLGDGTTLHAPWKLSSCVVDRQQDVLMQVLCLQERFDPPCLCEYSNCLPHAITARSKEKTAGKRSFELEKKSKRYREEGFGGQTANMVRSAYSIERILETLHLKENTVVLSAATFYVSQLALSWACNMRRLKLQNFLLAALDETVFELGVKHGIPVFLSSHLYQNWTTTNNEGCSFGTSCFKQTTKLKTLSVIQLLERGLNVLWTDVDVVWLKDPQKYLSRIAIQEKSHVLIQSNQADPTIPANALQSINSGFYLVKHNPLTLQAFAQIITEASLSNKSEQAHFYSVLCGKGGIFRHGSQKCEKSGLSTFLLDRELFPNGAYKQIWELSGEALWASNSYIIHNNWIRGTESKLARVMEKGMFFYNLATGSCNYTWNRWNTRQYVHRATLQS